ncbi:AAA family ATPase [Streptomyces sp. NPDC002012]|uniref:AAA family ATPase n=1 Tax=unclassified Streptomyces TaxID=2593676 RepID=UPI003329B866
MQFVVRQAERREINGLVASAAAGGGGVLVVAGTAGIGKSALLDTEVGALEGHTVVRASGAEFEQNLLYAALHQLCAPVLDHRQGLPPVQRGCWRRCSVSAHRRRPARRRPVSPSWGC